MSDLFRMLGSAAHSLEAQRFALDVTGQNIANVNTAGYVRRSVDFAEIAPRDPWSAGGGVDLAGVEAARAPLIESRLRHEQLTGAREAVVADQLQVILSGLGLPGASLDEVLTRFYTTYGELAQNPTSSPHVSRSSSRRGRLAARSPMCRRSYRARPAPPTSNCGTPCWRSTRWPRSWRT
jgi:flagellar hook-associated protein 1 FlgK